VALHPVGSLNELAASLDLAKLSRTVARFDPAELAALSVRTLHGLSFDAIRERLKAYDIAGHKAKPFWLATRGNLSTFLDVVDWWRVVEGEIAPVIEEAEFLATARASLPGEPWDETVWANWTKTLQVATGRTGKALFHPLRLALTGRDNGPELAALLPLIGKTKAAARLSGRAA
jgi:glutamyl-tRNA synthetase